jgi:hypothetical protein
MPGKGNLIDSENNRKVDAGITRSDENRSPIDGRFSVDELENADKYAKRRARVAPVACTGSPGRCWVLDGLPSMGKRGMCLKCGGSPIMGPDSNAGKPRAYFRR